MNKARLDIRAHGVWERGPKAFLDIRVFYPNACCYFNKSLQQYDVINKQEKKRAYNESFANWTWCVYTIVCFFNLWKYMEGSNAIRSVQDYPI